MIRKHLRAASSRLAGRAEKSALGQTVDNLRRDDAEGRNWVRERTGGMSDGMKVSDGYAKVSDGNAVLTSVSMSGGCPGLMGERGVGGVGGVGGGNGMRTPFAPISHTRSVSHHRCLITLVEPAGEVVSSGHSVAVTPSLPPPGNP